MIRINLARGLPPIGTGASAVEGLDAFEAAAAGEDSSQVDRQGAMRLLMILLVPLALYGYEYMNLPELSAKLRSKNTLLTSLTQKNEQAKGAVEEIKKFKEDQARLQKQIDTLDGLQKERLREVKILDNLQKDIPEKLWLTKIEFQEINLIIAGVTTSDSELTALMENLSKSVFLKEVNLVRSSESQTERGLVKKFEIVCVLDRPVLSRQEGQR